VSVVSSKGHAGSPSQEASSLTGATAPALGAHEKGEPVAHKVESPDVEADPGAGQVSNTDGLQQQPQQGHVHECGERQHLPPNQHQGVGGADPTGPNTQGHQLLQSQQQRQQQQQRHPLTHTMPTPGTPWQAGAERRSATCSHGASA